MLSHILLYYISYCGLLIFGVEGMLMKSALVFIICSRMGKRGVGKEIAKKEMEKRGGICTSRVFFRFVELQVKVKYRKGER